MARKKISERLVQKPRVFAINDELYNRICKKVDELDYNSVSELIREAAEQFLED